MQVNEIRSEYDVVIIGAGPAGCATAAALTLRGESVLLVEAQPAAADRFAGEWIHPSGVGVLRKYGLLPYDADERFGLGFAVFPDDGTDPIRLDYPRGSVALAYEHRSLVEHLRKRVRDCNGVHYVEGWRANVVTPQRLSLTKAGIDAREVTTRRIVGAGGRSFAKATHAHAGTTVSRMAGVTLEDVSLPCEGYGHLIAGGPGPVLAYRIGANKVRVCLDVPAHVSSSRRSWLDVAKRYERALPAQMRDAFMRACAKKIEWAANTFRPRHYDAYRSTIDVGDAVGTCHPLTAIGITMSLQDVDALASQPSRTVYAQSRQAETHIPELLSNALYQAFVRTDPGAQAIRSAMYRVWRGSTAHRTRTMSLLDGGEPSRWAFARSFLRVALDAGMRSAVTDGASLVALGPWMKWPLAGGWRSYAHRMEVMHAV